MYEDCSSLLQNCGGFSHKNRLIRATPSDLVQVPSKNVWLQSPVFLLYIVIRQTNRDCLEHTICLAHYILIVRNFKKGGEASGRSVTHSHWSKQRYYFNHRGRESQSSQGSRADSQSQRWPRRPADSRPPVSDTTPPLQDLLLKNSLPPTHPGRGHLHWFAPSHSVTKP